MVDLTVVRPERRPDCVLYWLTRFQHGLEGPHDIQGLPAFDDSEVRAVLEALDGGEQDDPRRAVEREQLGALIQTILDHLPARQGNVLEWKYVHGLSVREIAARLHTSETAVQSLLARARLSFREGFSAIAHAELDVLLN